MEQKRLYSLLAFAGAMPFVACALMPYLGYAAIPNIGSFDYVARVYGFGIVTFLTGVHWGTYLYKSESSPDNLFVTSNAVFLAVFFAFLLDAGALSLFVLMLAFLCLLYIDYRLLNARLIDNDYFRLRSMVTGIAVVSLAATILALATAPA